MRLYVPKKRAKSSTAIIKAVKISKCTLAPFLCAVLNCIPYPMGHGNPMGWDGTVQIAMGWDGNGTEKSVPWTTLCIPLLKQCKTRNETAI